MNVLHVIPALDTRVGGPVAALVGLTCAQVAAGLQVGVLAGKCDPASSHLLDTLKNAGVEVSLSEPLDLANSVKRPAGDAVHSALRHSRMVHIHGLWQDLQHQAAVAARSARVPYIMRPCGMLEQRSLERSRLKKFVYMLWRQRTDLRQACALHYSTATERDLTPPLGFHNEAIVEPNGIDLGEFQTLPLSGSFRRKYSIPEETRVLLFLGRIHPIKGLDMLIPAFSRLAAKNTLLVLAGPDEGGYEATVKGLIRDHMLQDRVLLTGLLQGEQRLAALVDANLFVLPSYQENFGLAALEALAAGTPVVVTEGVNLHHQIGAARVGGVAQPTVPSLAATLDRWLGDGQLLRDAALRTRPFALSQYDWKQIAYRWVEHYARLADTAGPSRSTRLVAPAS